MNLPQTPCTCAVPGCTRAVLLLHDLTVAPLCAKHWAALDTERMLALWDAANAYERSRDALETALESAVEYALEGACVDEETARIAQLGREIAAAVLKRHKAGFERLAAAVYGEEGGPR